MAIKSIQEQIESVQAAIDAIEGGAQQYRLGDQWVTKADLKTLYERLDQLMVRYAREQNNYKTRVLVAFK